MDTIKVIDNKNNKQSITTPGQKIFFNGEQMKKVLITEKEKKLDKYRVYQYDITPPIIAINPISGEEGISNNPYLIKDSSYVISGKVIDKESGVKKIIVNNLPVSIKNDGTFNIRVNFTDGMKTPVTIESEDNAGNIGNNIIYVKRDSTAPTISITSGSGKTESATYTLTATVKDSVTGIESIKIYDGTTLLETISLNNYPTTYNVQKTYNLDPGVTRNFKIVAVDRMQNSSEKAVSIYKYSVVGSDYFGFLQWLESEKSTAIRKRNEIDSSGDFNTYSTYPTHFAFCRKTCDLSTTYAKGYKNGQLVSSTTDITKYAGIQVSVPDGHSKDPQQAELRTPKAYLKKGDIVNIRFQQEISTSDRKAVVTSNWDKYEIDTAYIVIQPISGGQKTLNLNSEGHYWNPNNAQTGDTLCHAGEVRSLSYRATEDCYIYGYCKATFDARNVDWYNSGLYSGMSQQSYN